jgi:hypothetical protein
MTREKIQRLGSGSLFLCLWAGLYLAGMVGRFFTGFDSGGIFLTQTVALFITVFAVAIKPQWRRDLPKWIIAAIVSLLLVGLSYGEYLLPSSPSMTGPSPHIHYGCVRGESDGSIIRLIGDDIYHEKTTTNLCIIKNLPLAASGAIGDPNNAESKQFIVFFAYEAAIGGSFFAAGYVVNKWFGRGTWNRTTI